MHAVSAHANANGPAYKKQKTQIDFRKSVSVVCLKMEKYGYTAMPHFAPLDAQEQ
jgi:hypothetical protein